MSAKFQGAAAYARCFYTYLEEGSHEDLGFVTCRNTIVLSSPGVMTSKRKNFRRDSDKVVVHTVSYLLRYSRQIKDVYDLIEGLNVTVMRNRF